MSSLGASSGFFAKMLDISEAASGFFSLLTTFPKFTLTLILGGFPIGVLVSILGLEEDGDGGLRNESFCLELAAVVS